MSQLTDINTLSGPEKAAIFMLAIGDVQAAKLLKAMDHDELRAISQHMAHLGTVSSSVVEALVNEFTMTIDSASSLIGTYESTERLLSKVLEPERAQQIMEEIRGPSGRTMWDKLGNVNEGVLATYLKNEYPQTVAVVLSKIKSAHAARVLALFPESFAMEVVMRMLRMQSVQKEILDHVEKTLRTEFMSNYARSNRRDAHELMADIFNNFDRNTEFRFMAALEERNRESADRIKQLMFTFEDLSRLDSSGVQLLLRRVAKEQLTVALKGASETLKELFLTNMSERAGKMMQEDINAMGPVRLRDVDEAQAAIGAAAKALAEAHEIVIAGSDGADELVS